MFANRVNFTENDIINLMKQVPFVSVMKFITDGSSRLLDSGKSISPDPDLIGGLDLIEFACMHILVTQT